MLQKSDVELDRYREAMEVKRQEMTQLEMDLRKEFESGLKQMKLTTKDKYKKQIEQIEKSNADTFQLRAQEIENNLRELHAKDMEVQIEKFEMRLRTSFLEINEHENIVRSVQVKEREIQKSLLDEAQVAKDTCLAQMSNDLRSQAQHE